jgi:transposase InsO family protein
MHFITRLQAGEKMTDLCREFGISRKTGYKFQERFKKDGPLGLFDESRKPIHSPLQTSPQVRELILATRKQKPHWGASKIRSFLLIQDPQLVLPSKFTVHDILRRNGLVEGPKKRFRGTTASWLRKNVAKSEAPNDLWCADFKGQFRLGNGRYCYPLTITDHFSRFLLGCEGLEDTKGQGAMGVFRAVFREYGMPQAIRTDNGTPFASAVALYGLTQLSVWWMRLGISIERIEPGHPEQNGRHERMHLTLKQQTTRPAGRGLLEQQQRFDDFRTEFNQERPHEGLKMKRPKDVYSSSKRPFPKELPELSYPQHDLVATVYSTGGVRVKKSTIDFQLSTSLAGQPVGLREENDGNWRVTFMNLDLGIYNSKTKQFSPIVGQPPASGR